MEAIKLRVWWLKKESSAATILILQNRFKSATIVCSELFVQGWLWWILFFRDCFDLMLDRRINVFWRTQTEYKPLPLYGLIQQTTNWWYFFFNFIFQKTESDMSCKLSPLKTYCMKCQNMQTKIRRHTSTCPSEKGATLEGKNLLPLEANSYLLEPAPFQTGGKKKLWQCCHPKKGMNFPWSGRVDKIYIHAFSLGVSM